MDDSIPLVTGAGVYLIEKVNDFWQCASEVEKAYAFFHLPPEKRLENLQTIFKASPFVGYAGKAGEGLAIGWTIPTCQNAQTAYIHFLYARKNSQLNYYALAMRFLRQCAKHYKTLMAAVPIQFRGVRKFIDLLGFRQGPLLRRCAFHYASKRHLDCYFYTMDLEEKSNARY